MDQNMKLSGKERSVNQEKCAAKKAKMDNSHSLLNSIIYEEQFKTEFKQIYRNENHCTHEKDTVYNAYPFKYCILKNLVRDEHFLKNLKAEILELQFHMKSNDLYKFYQSNDLKTSTTGCISKFRKLLYDDCLSWIKYITDIPLDENTIDMSCAKYSNTDILLCHDDELEGRRIAYIFYLVPHNWDKNDRGSLDLFSIDEHGQPDKIVKSLVPEWNSLIFFEVTPKSFHQWRVGAESVHCSDEIFQSMYMSYSINYQILHPVSEIQSDKTRLSISGWFHGPPIVRPSPFKELPPNRQLPLHLKDETLISWINPLYLQSEVVEDIRKSFEDNSEVELKEFFLPDKYEALLKELSKCKVTWHMRGPANKRHYEVAIESSLTGIVQECFELLKSEPIFRLLTTLTGLQLSDVYIEDRDEEEETGGSKKQENPQNSKVSETSVDETKVTQNENTYSCHGDLCRWSHGCYTLIHDTDPEASEMSLDSIFFIGCDGWKEEFGGYTSYIAREEDEELLTVHPSSNSLALVYRDTDTMKFIKHINSRCKSEEEEVGSSEPSSEPSSEHFYNFMFTYFE